MIGQQGASAPDNRYGRLGRPLTDAEETYLIGTLRHIKALQEETDGAVAEIRSWLEALKLRGHLRLVKD